MPDRERLPKKLRVALSWTAGFLSAFGIALVVLTFPIAIPVGLAIEFARKGRMEKAADHWFCERCGRRLTRAAVEEADRRSAEFSQQVREAVQGHVDFWSDGGPPVCAICLTPGCGAKHTYHADTRTFSLLPNPATTTDDAADQDPPINIVDELEYEAERRAHFTQPKDPPTSAYGKGQTFGWMFIGCSIAVIFVALVLMAVALLLQPWTGWP